MARCDAVKRNVRVPDFQCSVGGDIPHAVHIDPATGRHWGYPGRKAKGGYPFGIRKDRSKNSGHARTAHRGVYYSSAKARN